MSAAMKIEKFVREAAALSNQDGLRFDPAVKLQYFEGQGFFQLLGFYRQMKG